MILNVSFHYALKRCVKKHQLAHYMRYDSIFELNKS